jgi:hypothetical protein
MQAVNGRFVALAKLTISYIQGWRLGGCSKYISSEPINYDMAFKA